MEKSNLVTIKFKSRNASNPTDKGIAEQYSQGGPFDVDLQTSDGKSVSAHRFVLVTFSKTWSNTLRNVGLDGVIALPIDVPHHIAKKLVELLYFREVHVLHDEKEVLLDAVKSLKICGVTDDDEFKVPKDGMLAPRQMLPQNCSAPQKIVQRRQSVAVTATAPAPGKRTLQRSQSVHPGSAPPHEFNQPLQSGQRFLHMNGAPNPNLNRNPNNTPGLKTSPQVAASKVPRPTNANGGSIQSTQNRQQQQPPPPAQGQMVAANRQPVQNQVSLAASLQRLGQVTIKKQIPVAQQKSITAPSPSPQQKPATQIQSKIPACVPSGLSVFIKQTPRNNQHAQHQHQQQQLVARTAQALPAVSFIPISANPTENAPKSVAPAASPVVQNGPNDQIDEIDDLPIDMDIDKTIGNGQTNDKDNSAQKVDNGDNENQSILANDVEDAGIAHTVTETNANGENRVQDPTDEDDEINEFDEDDYNDYGDMNNNNNTNTTTEHHDLRDILPALQDNETQ